MAGQFKFEGLKERRSRQGLSLEEVAKRAQVSTDVLRAVEDGGTCSTWEAREITRVLRADVEQRAELKADAGRVGITVTEV